MTHADYGKLIDDALRDIADLPDSGRSHVAPWGRLRKLATVGQLPAKCRRCPTI